MYQNLHIKHEFQEISNVIFYNLPRGVKILSRLVSLIKQVIKIPKKDRKKINFDFFILIIL